MDPRLERALVDLPYASEALRSRRIGSLELVEASLDRYRRVEPDIHSFVWLDEDRARRLASALDRKRTRGLLHGIPVAVKDIFDTSGIPTEYGSRAFAGRVPRASSSAVRSVEAAGGIVIGKTVTAELAYYTPGPTLNPWDLRKTPGGSSQGSAAAVAAGIVPGAIGSQTNGSVIRPAAYCGVVGLKPTIGRVSTAGALRFSRTLDHVGALTRTVDGAAILAAVLSRQAATEWHESIREAPYFAVVQTSDWDASTPEMQRQFLSDVHLLAADGARVDWPALPDGIDDAVSIVRVLMAFESARSIGARARACEDLLSGQTVELFEYGRSISRYVYEGAIHERLRLVEVFADWIRPYDAILTLAASGEAPDAETTGDPRFCSRWSLLGAPAISIPTALGPNGLPLALQIVGARGLDRHLLGIARWVEERLTPSAVGPPTIAASRRAVPHDPGPP